ncbi:MAG: hypothetical protein O7B79_05240 [SAR324 cluster bacterium]|nr:hypothetical protein [SAR324 cluster bacterium]
MNSITRKLTHSLLVLASMAFLAACGSSSETSSSTTADTTTTTTTASLKGQVSTDAGSSSALSVRSTVRQYATAGRAVIAVGCTVEARDINTGAVIGTAVTDSNGIYVIEGLEENENYEIIADCAGQFFSAFATADNVDPDSAEKSVDNVDARSTIIAAYISVAIKDAVDAALTSLADTVPQSVIDAIKEAIFDAVDEVITQITAEIESAIDSGQIVVDDQLADLLAESQDQAAGAETSFADVGVDDPSTIVTSDGQDSTVLDTVASGSAAYMEFQFACDTAVNSSATVASCTRLLAKTLYGLKESVAIINGTFGGGAFTGSFGSFTCSDTGVADIDGDTIPDFPEAQAEVFMPEPDVTVCFITPRLKAFDRNDPAGEDRDDDGEMVWFEGPGGLLHSMAVSLINGQRYTLASINDFVNKSESLGNDPLTGDPVTAGMGMRFFGQSGVDNTFYYLDGSASWKAFPPWPQCPWCGSIGPWDLEGIFDANWTVDATAKMDFVNRYDPADQTTVGDFIVALAAASAATPETTYVTDYFVNTFNGLTTEEVATVIETKRIHIDHNPSGTREFRVVYTEEPDFRDSETIDSTTGEVTFTRSACNDNDPTTPCLGISGAVEPAMRASITKDATGLITTVAAAASGDILFEPVYSPRGATTALRLIAIVTQDGVTRVRFLRDKYSQPLTLYAVTDDDVTNQTAPCLAANTTDPWGEPGAFDSSCAAGQFYMVREIWSQVSGTDQWNVIFARVADQPVGVTGIVLADLIRSSFDRTPANVAGGEFWVLGYYEGVSGGTPLSFYNSAGTLTQADDTTVGTKWHIMPWDICDNSGCQTVDQFVFIDSETGAFLSADPGMAGVIFTTFFDPANINGTAASVDCSELYDSVNGQVWDWITGTNYETLYNLINGAGKCDDTGVNFWEITNLIWGPDNATGEWLPYPAVLVTDFASIGGTAVNAFGSATTLASVVQRQDIFAGPIPNPGWSEALAPFFYDANDNGVRDTGEPTFDNQWDIDWLLGEYLCSNYTDPTNTYFYCWEDPNFFSSIETEKLKVRFVDNGFAFGNAVIANKLIGSAFAFQDNVLTIDSSTQLNALQGFATLFLFFTDEGGASLSGATVTEWDGATATKTLSLQPEFVNVDQEFDPNDSISGGLCSFAISGVGTAVSCPYSFP